MEGGQEVMGPQDYQDALDALNSPDAPAPVKAAAHRLVERYSSAMAGAQLKGHTADSLAEGSSIGPTGLDAMAAGGLAPQEDAAERERQIQASEAKHPGIARALSLRAPTAGPVIPGTNEYEQRRLHAEGLDLNPRLPNASKRPELDAPPEWHPPTPANPEATFDSVWGKLSAVKQALPDWAGGGTEHFVEPTVDQFHMEMAPVLGPAIATLDRNSDAYRSYADMKYRQALQNAQAEGRGIVREAFSKEMTPSLGPFSVAEAGSAIKSGLIGADKALTGGSIGTILHGYEANVKGHRFTDEPISVADAWRNAQRARDLNAAGAPITNDVGFALGVLQPGSIGNLAVEGAAKVAPKAIASRLTGLGGAAAKGGAAGFVGAGTSELATEAPDVVLGNQGAGDALEQAAKAGLWGVPLGVIGGALGYAGRQEGAKLRRETPLGEAERGGAHINPLTGVEPGPVNRGLEARARAADIGPSDRPDVESMLAHDLSKPFGERANAMEGELTQKGQPLREFERAHAGDKIPMKNTIRAILEAKRKLVQSDGTVAAVNQPEMAKLDKLLDDVMTVQPQLPESRLQPRNEQLLNQLENAAEAHDFRAPEDVAHVVKEAATPTRPITPAAEEAVASRPRSDTQFDLGPYAEGLPDARGGIAAGMAGERLRSLQEARGTNPHTFDITPKEAEAAAIDVGGPENFGRLSPKPKNPADVRALSQGVRQRHESGSTTKEPFPDYDKIKRAFHEDRDAFIGETGQIKQSDTFDLPGGKTVRGYSAANARLEQETRQFEDFLNLIGFKGGKPPRVDEPGDFVGMENAARNYGRGGRSPAIDEALRKMAAETGMEPTLQNLQRYRAMKELEQMSRLKEIFRFGGAPSVGSLSGPAARLRLDPILQKLIGPLERAGSLGALPEEIDQRQQVSPMADQETIDEIERALFPNGPLVQSPVEAKKDLRPVSMTGAPEDFTAGWEGVSLESSLFPPETAPAFSLLAPPIRPGSDLRPAHGYSYEYKDPHAPGAAPGKHYGPVTRDLKKTPAGRSVVVNDPRTGMEAVDTSRLSLVNTSAISEQQRRIDQLEKALDDMAKERPQYDLGALDAAYARQSADVQSDRRSKKKVQPYRSY